MMPPVHDAHAGRVRAAVGVALAATSLGLVVWFTCRPAGADHLTTNDPQERVLEAASPRSSVVVSVLRSEPRLADPGTPISDAEWSRHHAAARVQVAPELGRTLLARSIPPEGELQLDSAPSGTNAPIGNVTHVENGSLRVIDGWTNGSEDLQIELRLTPSETGAPQVEVGAWDVRGNEAPGAWSDVSSEVTLNASTWKDGERVVLRYRVQGKDAQGKTRDEGGLVRVVVP